jgi:hypothetical protein
MWELTCARRSFATPDDVDASFDGDRSSPAMAVEKTSYAFIDEGTRKAYVKVFTL